MTESKVWTAKEVKNAIGFVTFGELAANCPVVHSVFLMVSAQVNGVKKFANISSFGCYSTLEKAIAVVVRFYSDEDVSLDDDAEIYIESEPIDHDGWEFVTQKYLDFCQLTFYRPDGQGDGYYLWNEDKPGYKWVEPEKDDEKSTDEETIK